MSTPKLDEAHVHDLIQRLMEPIKQHMAGGTPSRTKVFEAMNAIAVVIATILASTKSDVTEARMWFDNAVDQSIVDVTKFANEAEKN
jgi:hypothetical protein